MSQKTVYASAARTATPAAAIVTPRQYETALRVVLDATAITSTPSVVVTVEEWDNAAGKYVTLLTSAAIATVSVNVLTLIQGLSGTPVRITCTHGNANSITYSVGAHFSRS